MTTSLFYSAYILFAFYLYNKNKQFWNETIRDIKEKTPVSDEMLVFPLFIALLTYPLLMIHYKIVSLLGKLGIVWLEGNESSDDGEYFIETYYPEVKQNLKGVSIILDKDDINSFIDKIIYLFESGFSEQERFKIEKAIERLTEEEKENLYFYVIHDDKRFPLIVEIKFNEDDRRAYQFTFYTRELLAEAIDKNINNFCGLIDI